MDGSVEEPRAQSQIYVCKMNAFPRTRPSQLVEGPGALSTGEGESLLLLPRPQKQRSFDYMF